MLHLHTGASIRRSAVNNQVSMAQFKKRKSTGLDQTQGLFILASFVEPKLTVGA